MVKGHRSGVFKSKEFALGNRKTWLTGGWNAGKSDLDPICRHLWFDRDQQREEEQDRNPFEEGGGER